MSGPLILSIFPGIDLLGMAFEEVWPEACIVRGPDLIWGGDVKRFHPPAGKFDGVIGGPPCQCFSQLWFLVEHNGYDVAENLIPEYERVVTEAGPEWFLMENVVGAPLPSVHDYLVRDVVLNNRSCGGEQNRVRRFSFGTHDGRSLLPRIVALEPYGYTHAVLASGGGKEVPVAIGGSGKPKRTGGRIRKARDLGYKTKFYAAAAAAAAAQGLDHGMVENLVGPHGPFTVAGVVKLIGNGVPLYLGRAIARAVREAVEPASAEARP